MGGLFCSYLIDNRISRLRKAILNSELNDIRIELKSSSNNPITIAKSHRLNGIGEQSNHTDGIINTQIDSYGNTPLIYSIETRQIDSFRLLLVEFKADPNRANYETDLKPLHICASARIAFSTSSESQKRSYKYGTSSTAFTSEIKSPQSVFDISETLKQKSINSLSTNISESQKTKFTNDSTTLMITTPATIAAKHQQHQLQPDLMIKSTISDQTNQISKFKLKEPIRKESKKFLTLAKSDDTVTGGLKKSRQSSTTSSLTGGDGTNNGFIEEDMLREMIQLLVKYGADLNSVSRFYRTYGGKQYFDLKTATPLFLAILSSNTVAINEFVSLGCDCNYQDPHSKIAAIHIACRFSRVDIVNVLLEKGGARLDLKSKEGNTCLHWLAMSERDDIGVLQLLMNYVKRKFLSEYNIELKEETTNLLQEYLRDFVDQRNNDSRTALMLAAMNNKQNLLKFLLDYEASIDMIDKYGFSALNYAQQNSCASLLTSYNKVKRLHVQKSTQFLIPNRPDSEQQQVPPPLPPLPPSQASQPSLVTLPQTQQQQQQPQPQLLQQATERSSSSAYIAQKILSASASLKSSMVIDESFLNYIRQDSTSEENLRFHMDDGEVIKTKF